MRVVALVPGGIKNQILFFPTLDDLKRSYPDAEIDIVVEPMAKEAYRVSKSINDTIPFDFPANNSPADWANLLGVIRDRTYDVAIAAGGGWSVGLLLWLTGTPARIGYANSGAKPFLTQVVPFKGDRAKADSYHDLLQAIDIHSNRPELAISLPKTAIDWAEREQRRLGLKGGYVLLYPDAHYPLASWQAIAQDFQTRQPEISLVVIQTDENSAITTELSRLAANVKATQPEELAQTAALIAGANLLLCTAQAPIEVAIALKVYTLALLGSDVSVPMQHERFVAVTSKTQQIADIAPGDVLQKVWGG